MKKKTKLIIGAVLGISATVGLFVYAGWEIAICIILIMWADNISRNA